LTLNFHALPNFHPITKDKKGDMTKWHIPYFINPTEAPRLTQMPGHETTIITGLHGEKMMMVLSSTLPGYTVPMHSHFQEQIGTVCAGKAMLRIGDEERVVQKGDFYCIPAYVPHGDTCIGDEPFIMLDIFCLVRENFIEKLGQTSREDKDKEAK
jgi:quercetin dioxygenase-like cupin family protein